MKTKSYGTFLLQTSNILATLWVFWASLGMLLSFILWLLVGNMFHMEMRKSEKSTLESPTCHSQPLPLQLSVESRWRPIGLESEREAKSHSFYKSCTSTHVWILSLLQLLPTSRASERKQICFEVQETPLPWSLAPEWTSQAPIQPPWKEIWWLCKTIVTIWRLPIWAEGLVNNCS